MMKLSFKAEIFISVLTEHEDGEIFSMEQNLDMSEIKTSRVNS